MPNNQLTRREIEVAECVIEKLTNAEIAKKLFISRRTVEIHRSHIIKKMGLNRKIESLRDYLLFVKSQNNEPLRDAKVEIYHQADGIVCVCSDLPQIEVELIMRSKDLNKHKGWRLAPTFNDDRPNPCSCDIKVDTHKHYLFIKE